jgi:hypothetical protein
MQIMNIAKYKKGGEKSLIIFIMYIGHVFYQSYENYSEIKLAKY